MPAFVSKLKHGLPPFTPQIHPHRRSSTRYGQILPCQANQCTSSPGTKSIAQFVPISRVTTITHSPLAHQKAAYIPALIIGLDDIAGDRCIVPKQDGYFYYDPCAAPLHSTIIKRTICLRTNDTALDDPEFFSNYAVRVFVQVPHVAGITDGPLYKYIGDYYVHKTESYLSRKDWATLRKDVSWRIFYSHLL